MTAEASEACFKNFRLVDILLNLENEINQKRNLKVPRFIDIQYNSN